ncbi:MAG: hypothetical protein E7235_00970 [Lachnospiraceae bacterium]|nr:hypothetical protein [Lachnospiraceae bacterium]
MSTCTFFGHRDCPSSIKPKLREVIIDLIENQDVDMFYVGHQGNFDAIVRSVLKELVLIYTHIDYAVVLARMPVKKEEFDTHNYSDTILPEGIENVHPRFAISWRNRWMIAQSDYVVTYVTHSWGGASQFAEIATQKNYHVININEKIKDC